MGLNRKLPTGDSIGAWSYGTPCFVGIALGIKNKNGDYVNVVNAEGVKCSDGIINRLVIKKSLLEKKGWVIIEE